LVFSRSKVEESDTKEIVCISHASTTCLCCRRRSNFAKC